MRIKWMLVGIAGLALAVPIAASAGSGTDRATGGGQILVSSDGGAGDTIAFTAQGAPEPGAAQGEVQYVDRTGGTGQGQTVKHGRVSCLRVSGNMAKMAGTWDQGGTFQLLVADNGEGALAPDSDMITIQDGQDPTCDQENNDNDGRTALARGNAQVYDAP